MAIYKSIPVSKCRIRLVDNRKTKYSLQQMWKLYGGPNVTIMNGPFFNMQTRNPLTHTKVDGAVLYQPADYNEYGIGWKKNGEPEWGVLPNAAFDSYFTNTVVMPNGKKRAVLSSHPDADGTKAKPRITSRPAFGFDGKNFVFGVEKSIGLWAYQDLLYKKGWKYAFVGDGGASTAFKDSKQMIKPARTISVYVVITELDATEDDEVKGEKPVIPIYAYSWKKDGEKALSANFKVKEFRCKDNSDTIFVASALVELLQKIRDHYKKPVNINSAYRTETYNKKIGGADYSQHKYGTAADIYISGVTPAALYTYVDSLLGNKGGIGKYKNFVHVDVREVKARWSGT